MGRFRWQTAPRARIGLRSTEKGRAMGVAVALVLGVVAGAVIPLQTAINSRLAGRLGAILLASLVSFAVGTAALALALLATGAPLPLARTAATEPWWIWIGGLCGLVFLTMNIVLLPRIGASATVILPLVGQVFGGLAIDAVGGFGAPFHALTFVRGLGAALVVGGAVLVNFVGQGRDRPQKPGDSGPVRPTRTQSPSIARFLPGSRTAAAHGHPVLWAAAVGVGGLGAVQTAVNGRLGQVMGSGLAAALVSFAIGLLGLAVICLVTRQRLRRSGALRPWHFAGGLLGAVFVLVNAINAPILGTSLAVSITLLGQVAIGLFFDHHGWMGVPRRRASALRVLGAVVVLLGVALVRLG